eukprot:CAMPEP_0114554912 /NCGR_PEP_ID=MMETSP0114-20121206/8464_1 /TAXON_ID=31324 /ORGANISM="Goniomonas sp, Strain m" /LENGTH=243 /DNA_ID=CAMNT_0001739993 /DNA_START=19 /DNA_END=750 /DNA_ORIENTATION=-
MPPVIELLRFSIPEDRQEVWLQAESCVWKPFLSAQPGYRWHELWQDASEIHSVICWDSKEDLVRVHSSGMLDEKEKEFAEVYGQYGGDYDLQAALEGSREYTMYAEHRAENPAEDDRKGRIELMRFSIPVEFQKVWLEAELEAWTPFLARKEGYLFHELWQDETAGECLSVIRWRSTGDLQRIHKASSHELDEAELRFAQIYNKHGGDYELGEALTEAREFNLWSRSAPGQKQQQCPVLLPGM